MRSMALAMMRDDWWWPWWVSSLIDLGVVAIAATVFLASSRRRVRLIAGTFAVAGLIAAVAAPIVMTEDSDEPRMDRMERGEAPRMTPGNP
jgi:K+ transporter